MSSVKKIILAALVAFALAAGGVAVSGEAAQLAGSAGAASKVVRESASVPTQAEELQQVAGSAGTSSKVARESS